MVLRDPAGRVRISILEQNYRTDIASQQNLLRAYEGKEIQFQTASGIVAGKVIRAGGAYGNGCYNGNCGYAGEAIIEIDGKIQFGLPGIPIFPGPAKRSSTSAFAQLVAQCGSRRENRRRIGYISGGFSWEASYNIVAPDTGDLIDITGWITLQNHSGRTFENAHLQLMAGEVNKILNAMTLPTRLAILR